MTIPKDTQPETDLRTILGLKILQHCMDMRTKMKTHDMVYCTEDHFLGTIMGVNLTIYLDADWRLTEEEEKAIERMVKIKFKNL